MAQRPVYFERLDLGLDTRSPPRKVARGALQVAQNVDISGRTAKKRPGTLRRNATELNSGVVVLGLSEWEHSTGGTKRFAHAGNKFLSLDGSFVATQIGAIVADTGRPPGLAVARDFLAVANRGTAGSNYLWDGTAAGGMQAILGGAPSGTVVLADGGAAGNLDDGAVYQYKFTLYSSVYGFETAASAAFSVDLTAGQTKVSVDFPAGYLDALGAIWDKIRVYRTEGGGAVFKLHPTLQTADFTDNTADSGLGATLDDPLMAAPPACYFAVHFHDRLWLTGASGAATQHRVYVSDVGLPGDFPATNVLTLEDRRAVTGIIEFADMLCVGTLRSISVIRDIDRSFAGLVLRNRVQEYGFASGFALKEIDGRLWFLDPTRGVCRMDASGNVEEVSREIVDDLTTDLEPTRAAFAYMGLNVRLKQLWLSVTLDAGATNTRVYVCQYDEWKQTDYGPQPKWTGPFTLPAASFAAMTGSDSNENLHFGSNDGFIYEANRAVRQDGTPSDVANGTATSGSTTTCTDTGAGFPTAGSALKGVEVTIKDATDGTYATATITSNTATILTFAAIGFAVASGDKYWIGPIDAILKTGSDQLGQPIESKKVSHLVFTHTKETHTEGLDVGRFLDEAATVAALVGGQRLDDASNASPIGRKTIGDGAYGEGYAVEFRARGSRDGFEVHDLAVVVDGQLPRH